jgi:thymidine phosphorylase
VTAGAPLLTLHTDTPDRFDRALEALDDAYESARTASPRPTW